MRHFLNLFELTADEARGLLNRALALKQHGRNGSWSPLLSGRTLGLLFEKPSLRTRVSFQAAIAQLGGSSIFLSGKDVGLGQRESIADFARVISQYVDILAVRTFAHETVAELARHATVPVINALCDTAHPCQAMADMLTITEVFGRLDGIKLVFVGDGNNVARSLAVASARLGVEFVLSSPDAYRFPEAFQARFAAEFPDVPLRLDGDPARAVRDAHVVYTDVWASMGQESESEQRRQVFAPYRVEDALFGRARPDAIFLHCLPAHRGEEVTDSVLDGPRSRVVLQAANRLHFQKELLLWLLGRRAEATTTRHGRPIRVRARRH